MMGHLKNIRRPIAGSFSGGGNALHPKQALVDYAPETCEELACVETVLADKLEELSLIADVMPGSR